MHSTLSAVALILVALVAACYVSPDRASVVCRVEAHQPGLGELSYCPTCDGSTYRNKRWVGQDGMSRASIARGSISNPRRSLIEPKIIGL